MAEQCVPSLCFNGHQVCAAIVFEAGVIACLEYLEAVPWQEDEEEKVTALLTQLQLDRVGAADVLKRCCVPPADGGGSGGGTTTSTTAAPPAAAAADDVLLRLLQSVTNSTDDKARREMKALVSRLLRENYATTSSSSSDATKDSLYRACHACLDSLLHLFMQATGARAAPGGDPLAAAVSDRGATAARIARQADNLHWLADTLIDRRAGAELVRTWAHQSELAALHAQVPTMFRYEVSRVTARLCVAVGKAQVVCPADVRAALLRTWLPPLVDDFGWMQRCCKGGGFDRKVVEEGVSQAVLTLPVRQQQSILVAWFDRFAASGDDCPNLSKAFEVWWRRMFVRPYAAGAAGGGGGGDAADDDDREVLVAVAAPTAAAADLDS